MSKLIPTNHFRKQYKKVKNNSRWNNIFNGKVPFENDNRSPWEYVIDCLIEGKKLPTYFYEHPITLTNRQKQEIKNRFDDLSNIQIQGIDIHFDGHNGDHLLIFIRTNKKIIYLIGIGTHSDLF
ncbi:MULTISPECIES: type II toxin-antitoxin system YafQ family toxin [Lactobacillus]|uniref:type II toxin-antitoxin system YafQ family toxin n=1 Tax=Lactobacillus TaxID=1578 RepID=UPI002491962F|nr:MULTISPECIES: type II toxin-antitoxin system YafQ family toxin [Lactobacillus]